jgi:hypothetical protein
MKGDLMFTYASVSDYIYTFNQKNGRKITAKLSDIMHLEEGENKGTSVIHIRGGTPLYVNHDYNVLHSQFYTEKK